MTISEVELQEYLVERKEYLEKLLSRTIKQTEKISTELIGTIRVQKKGKKYQYYLRQSTTDSNGVYLNRSYDKQVKQFVQKQYNSDIIKAATQELNYLTQYIKNFPPTQLDQVYAKLSIGKKELVTPINVTDEEYIKNWESIEYEGRHFSEDAPEFYTAKGERVRSKSEVIIANLLNKYDIPYRYEYPMVIDDIGTIYPDFTALNVRKRKEVIIEHFGLLDDPGYLKNALKKLTGYELEGYYNGENLLITYELSKLPLNISMVEKQIKRMLL